MKRKLMISTAAVAACLFLNAADDYAAMIDKLVAEDVAKPVRPYGVDGQDAFWNIKSVMFMYPPILNFPIGAAGMPHQRRGGIPASPDRTDDRVIVIGANGYSAQFRSASAAVSLVPIWKDIPVGEVKVACRGQTTTFWKSRPYYAGLKVKPPRSFNEAIKRANDYLLNVFGNSKTFLETGKPSSYVYNCYPGETHAGLVHTLVLLAKEDSANREKALKIARAAADYLISISQSADAPLAYFAPTYEGDHGAAKGNRGQNLLMYPADAATAYLELYQATKEKKYLDQAVGTAETYLRLQGADGSWPLRMWEKDGKEVAPNRLLPVSVIPFLDALADETGRAEFRKAADRALDYMLNVTAKNWDWEQQFEDSGVERQNYTSMSGNWASDFAVLVLKRYPKDPKRVAVAREVARWVEDQFCCWERPYKQEKRSLCNWQGWIEWPVDVGVCEQYIYRMPVDMSTGKLALAYLWLSRVSGSPLDLAKAKTLAEAIVCAQYDNGMIRTTWDHPNKLWLSNMAFALDALREIAKETDEAAH